MATFPPASRMRSEYLLAFPKVKSSLTTRGAQDIIRSSTSGDAPRAAILCLNCSWPASTPLKMMQYRLVIYLNNKSKVSDSRFRAIILLFPCPLHLTLAPFLYLIFLFPCTLNPAPCNFPLFSFETHEGFLELKLRIFGGGPLGVSLLSPAYHRLPGPMDLYAMMA